MKRFRLIAIWAALVAILLLAIFSIVGSVLGAITKEGVVAASNMFNSLPMVCFWSLLVCLLAVGFFCFKRLLRSPGLLGAHLGSMLILIGAMWGSAGGHAVAERLLGTRKIPSARMVIFEHNPRHPASHDAADVLLDKEGNEIARLPFKISLKDFWLEYYWEWLLLVDAPPTGGSHQRRREKVDWTVGQEIDLPLVNARLTVLQHLPGARKAYPEDAPRMLEVVDANGIKTTVEPKVGQKIVLKNPKGVLYIVKVFSNLIVRKDKAVDQPGLSANPALQLLFEGADGSKMTAWAYPRQYRAHSHAPKGVQLLYVMPKAVVVADPHGELPAIEVLLTSNGKRVRKWLLATDIDHPIAMSLTPLIGSPTTAGADANSLHKGHDHNPNTYLVLGRHRGMIKDYKSSLVVLEEGHQILAKVIEVNDPLHYGGYHFYQSSYGENERGEYTVLSVTSDSGLWMVYAGFILICAGVFWLFWFQPALAYLTKAKRQ